MKKFVHDYGYYIAFATALLATVAAFIFNTSKISRRAYYAGFRGFLCILWFL